MKYTTFYLSGILALCLFYSCSKVNESIQRDIVLSSGPVTFNIPVISVFTDSTLVKLGTFNASANLDEMIKSETQHEFGAANILNIKISQLTLELSETDTVNSLGNFLLLNAQLVKGSDAPITLASKDNNPTSTAKIINLPIVSGSRDLKQYLEGTNTSYTINAIVQSATTKVMKATVTPYYTITLGR